ncbi:VOC family protein [Anaerobacillus alkaliphilus]|uniref:VOC family protein n=1 Tax=Anaerobacillus alkaliphilus TaxID=1548597 RepID=A0A4Q0VX71_9BACI|nr:VOC family protein [Anaerobacillus alkaliphilus]RXJ04333.1 VOC family protein [Anaerobacillus alkaliphilus]
MSGFHQKPNTYVSELTLKVQDLKRSIDFYQSIVGFQVLEETSTKVRFTADGTRAILTIEQPEDILPKQERTTGLYHFAILLPSRKELGKFIQHLAQMAFQIQGAANHEISEAIYFADPDGNGIEVYSDTPSSTWRWQNGLIEAENKSLDFMEVVAEGKGETWTGLSPETILGHIHLHVADMDKTEEFYCRGLGFEVVIRMANHALFFSTGNYHHHIGTNIWNGLGAPKPLDNSVGLTHFTIIFPDEETRIQVAANIQKLGYEVTNFTTTYPSGNKIELGV